MISPAVMVAAMSVNKSLFMGDSSFSGWDWVISFPNNGRYLFAIGFVQLGG